MTSKEEKKGGAAVKKKFNLRNTFGKRTMILASVALVLITIMVVGSSVSWIEDVSRVEFKSSDDAQKTPLHVGEKVLQSDVIINSTNNSVNLGKYFYQSGDMHLSPCYGDGDNFYFPIEGSSPTSYRTGTKDDANTNYLSATFRVRSDGSNAVFWFEKLNDTPFVTFQKGKEGEKDESLSQNLRCSITVDGATTVYAMSSDGKFKTVDFSGSSPAVSNNTGRKLTDYTYYQEKFYDTTLLSDSAANDAFPNQGAEENVHNLNGNTVFSLAPYNAETKAGVKIVTVKVWLEYTGSTAAVDLTDINLGLISSRDKERRIFVKDMTVHEDGYQREKWLSTYSGKLFWGIKDDLANKHWEAVQIGSSDYYYLDVPAIYNNTDVVLFRCSQWNKSDAPVTYNGGNTPIKCWNYWETTFPDTFHSETFYVYSSKFGTWDGGDVNAVYFVNSAYYENPNQNDPYRYQFTQPKAYMWDSKTVFGEGQDDKVVVNAPWTGLNMTKLVADSFKGLTFSENSNPNENCKINTDSSEDGYYTFTLTVSNNVLRLKVAFSLVEPAPISGDSSSYKLKGNFGSNYGWQDLQMLEISDNCYRVYVGLDHGKQYQFKIHNGDTYYSNTADSPINKETTKETVEDVNAFSLYTFHYTSDYDMVVFNDGVTGGENKEYQSQNRAVVDASHDWSNYTFDMATLTWFEATPNDTTNLPTYSAGNTYLWSNFVTGRDRWVKTPFAYGGQYGSTANNAFNGTNENNMLCKIYNKAKNNNNSDYKCKVCIDGTWYGSPSNVDHRLTPGNTFTLTSNNEEDIYLEPLKDKTIYRLYLQNDNGTYKLHLSEGAADTTE